MVKSWFFGGGLEIVKDGNDLAVFCYDTFIGRMTPDDMEQVTAVLDSSGEKDDEE